MKSFVGTSIFIIFSVSSCIENSVEVKKMKVSMQENDDVRQKLFPCEQLDSIIFEYNKFICGTSDSLNFDADHKIVLDFYCLKGDTLMSIFASFNLPVFIDSSRYWKFEQYLYNKRVLISDYIKHPVGTNFYFSKNLSKYNSEKDTLPPAIYDGEPVNNFYWKFRAKNNKLILFEKKRGLF